MVHSATLPSEKDVSQLFEMKRLLSNRNAGYRVEDGDGRISFYLEEVGADGKDRDEFLGHTLQGAINRLKAMQEAEMKRAKAALQRHAHS